MAPVGVDVVAVVALLAAVDDAVAAEGAAVGPARIPRTAGAVSEAARRPLLLNGLAQKAGVPDAFEVHGSRTGSRIGAR